jgi:hypothetical protein
VSLLSDLIEAVDQIEAELQVIKKIASEVQRATADGDIKGLYADVDKLNADRKRRGAPPIFPLITNNY